MEEEEGGDLHAIDNKMRDECLDVSWRVVGAEDLRAYCVAYRPSNEDEGRRDNLLCAPCNVVRHYSEIQYGDCSKSHSQAVRKIQLLSKHATASRSVLERYQKANFGITPGWHRCASHQFSRNDVNIGKMYSEIQWCQ